MYGGKHGVCYVNTGRAFVVIVKARGFAVGWMNMECMSMKRG